MREALAETVGGSGCISSESRPRSDGATEMAESMAEDPVIFACANPVPEIYPDEAKAGRSKRLFVQPARSDFPNQINNVLGLPWNLPRSI